MNFSILVLASIMLVILDFDRSVDGFIRVSDDSIEAVIAEMEEDLAQDQATLSD